MTLDVDAISDDDPPDYAKYRDENGRVQVPEAESADLPDYIEAHFPDGPLTHGTVVVFDKLDKLTWITATALESKLLQHVGITYRNFLRNTETGNH